MSHTEHVRPRGPDAARQALLDAARDAFARHGFEGARVDEIAAVAGYNKALIFRYFGDKLGLYRAVVTHTKHLVHEEIARPLLAIACDPDTPLDAAHVRRFITTSVRCSFDFYVAHPQCMRMMAWEAAEGWHTFTFTLTAGDDNYWMRDICAFTTRAREAGLLRRDVDPMLLIANTISLTFGYHSAIPRFQAIFPAADLVSADALGHAREEITRLILHGTIAHSEGEEYDAAQL